MKSRLAILAVIATSSFIACQQTSQSNPNLNNHAVGKVELSFDLERQTASAAFTSNQLRTQALLNPQTAVSFSSNAFNVISDGTNKFLVAQFNVSNTSGAALSDLTLVAAQQTGNRASTAIKNLQNFAGLNSAALDTYAQAVKPAHAMTGAPPTVLASNADAQFFTETETSALQTEASALLASGEYLFPYGYVARATGSSTSRSIANGSNTGTLTVGVKLPANNEPSSSVYRFSMTFIAFTQPTATRVSESVEEQGTSSGAETRGGTGGFDTLQTAAVVGSGLLQTNDKLVNACRVRTAGTAASPTAFLYSTALVTTAGSYDQCFAANGKRQISANEAGISTANGSEKILAMAVQSDGKIVLAGWTIFAATGTDFLVMRLNADGSFDRTFDGDGKATINVGGGAINDQANAVVIQSDGKIVVGGYAGSSNPSFSFAVTRLNTNGSIDTSFNTTGFFTSDSGFNNEDIVTALALQTVSSVNYIVAAGTARENNSGSSTGNPVNNHGALFRLKVSDGTLDTTFGSSGFRTFSFAGSSSTPLSGTNEDFVNGVVVDASNRIIVAGNDFLNATPFVTNAGVIRFTTSGAWDIKAVTDIVSGGVGGLVLESTNATTTNVIVFGSGTNIVGTLTNTDPMAMKFTLGASSGAVDTTWGNQSPTNGRTYIRVNPAATSTNFGVARAATRQSDGKIILAGRQRFNGNGLSAGDTVLIRLNANGTADTNFGTSGIVNAQRQNGNVDEAQAATVNAGKVLIAGFERVSSNTPIQDDMFVLQFNP
jgi:uncharacterized delta-60 repeat protein